MSDGMGASEDYVGCLRVGYSRELSCSYCRTPALHHGDIGTVWLDYQYLSFTTEPNLYRP